MIRTYPRPAFLAVALLAGGLLSITARAQTPATWVNPVDGNWTDATRWSTNPLFPNNTGPTYNAFIDQTGAPYTVTLDQGITVTDLHLTSADAILDLTTNNLVVAGDFFQASARLRGSSTGGTLTVAGTASFTGSFAAPAVVGVSTFIAQSALVFTPVTTIDICDTEVYHDGVAATWNGGDIRLDHGAHYHEGVNGTFNITSNGTLSYPALGAQSGFINAGVIRKSAGTGVTFFNGVDLDNTGTVQVEAGTFRADRPVQVSGSTLTGGRWKVMGGSSLDLVGAAITTNRGDVTLDGATSSFAAINGLTTNDTAGSLSVQNGRDFTTTSAPGSDFTNNGQITVGAGSTFQVDPANHLTNYNTGTGALTGGHLAVSGTFKFPSADIQTLAADVTLSGPTSAIVNTAGANGLANLATVAPTGALSIQNGRNFQTGGNFTVAEVGADKGSLSIGPGTLFRVAPGSTLTNFASNEITLGGFNIAGRLQFDGAAINSVNTQIVLSGPGPHIINELGIDAFLNLNTIKPAGDLGVKEGQHLMLGGTLALKGRLGIGPSGGLDSPSIVDVHDALTQDPGGILDLDNGILTLSTFAPSIFNGLITGHGSINGSPILNGVLAPGSPLGRIIISDDFTINPGSSLNVDLGGTAVSSYDQVSVLGTVVFAPTGTTLNVALINGFTPAGGEIFDIINHNARTGTFETVNLPALSGGLTWDVRYLQDSVELVVVPAPGGLAVLLAGAVMARRRRSTL